MRQDNRPKDKERAKRSNGYSKPTLSRLYNGEMEQRPSLPRQPPPPPPLRPAIFANAQSFAWSRSVFASPHARPVIFVISRILCRILSCIAPYIASCIASYIASYIAFYIASYIASSVVAFYIASYIAAITLNTLRRTVYGRGEHRSRFHSLSCR